MSVSRTSKRSIKSKKGVGKAKISLAQNPSLEDYESVIFFVC
jgi:hypothetical protein